jgi:hypothetical protein
MSDAVARTTGADRSIAALRDTAALQMADVVAAINEARHAQVAFREASDLLDVMGTMGRLIVALEAMHDRAGAAEKACRDALAAQLVETGAMTLQTDAHLISAKKASRSVVITGAVPAEFLTTPAPSPDKKAIGAKLKEGALDWAHLSNGGPPVLQIKRRDV